VVKKLPLSKNKKYKTTQNTRLMMNSVLCSLQFTEAKKGVKVHGEYADS